MCEPTQTGITNAPHVAKGMVFMGYNGSDDGVRGAIAAYDANTGKELWRFWTVPGDPKKPFESKALKEIAAKTWPGGDAWKIGGGDAWTAITYDPVTDYRDLWNRRSRRGLWRALGTPRPRRQAVCRMHRGGEGFNW